MWSKLISTKDPIPNKILGLSYAIEYQESDESDHFKGTKAKEYYKKHLPAVWLIYNNPKTEHIPSILERLKMEPEWNDAFKYYTFNHTQTFYILLLGYIILKNLNQMKISEVLNILDQWLDNTKNHKEPSCMRLCKGVVFKGIWENIPDSQANMKRLLLDRLPSRNHFEKFFIEWLKDELF